MATRLFELIPLPSPLPLALFGLLIASTGCDPTSIEADCEEIARQECEACYSCAADITDGPSGAELCRLAADTEQSGCVDRLQGRCEDQASTLEDSSDDLQACIDSLADQACEPLYGAWAQERDSATNACAFFL